MFFILFVLIVLMYVGNNDNPILQKTYGLIIYPVFNVQTIVLHITIDLLNITRYATPIQN